MTTREEIRTWLQRGIELGATHMIVMCDTFNYDDYPTYVLPGQDVREMSLQQTGNMQIVMEVYNLELPLEIQIDHQRCFNY